MRKIILNIAASLDGFIEGPKGEFDWCFIDQDYGMSDFLNRIDTIFFGRKSYELILKMSKNPFPDKTKYVFSKTKKYAEDKTRTIDQDFKKEIDLIKNQAGKDIWLFGGTELITTLINYRLVDELHLAVHPLLLGLGKPLFKDINGKIEFALTDTKTYSTGLVQLFYELIGK
ncbi:MAG: dihydrofolate reductase [Candidatus Aminicenantes bacterium]|nr:MAG: dihydrofolate reductase [Candidatus Aminicenantes bacterium]